MAPYRKYMFDLDFGRPPPPPVDENAPVEDAAEEEELPPPPMFSEEELNVAREAAFAEGQQAGRDEAARGVEQMAAAALVSLGNQMSNVFRQQEDASDTNARNAVRVAVAVLKKVLPAACAQGAFDEVIHVVEGVVDDILDEPRIIVKVAPALMGALGDRLQAVCSNHGFEGRVVVQEDARLLMGDCRVEWADGGAERDQARLLAEVEAAVERALNPPEHPPATAPADDISPNDADPAPVLP